MRKYNSLITTVAVLLCWAAAGVVALAQHEGHGGQKPPAPSQNNRRQPEMRRQGGQMEMPMMTMTLNNLLAMSYLQNIATYARLLRDQVQQCGSVDGDFARDVTAEIWRSFDQLDRYRREQKDKKQSGGGGGGMRGPLFLAADAASGGIGPRAHGAGGSGR